MCIDLCTRSLRQLCLGPTPYAAAYAKRSKFKTSKKCYCLSLYCLKYGSYALYCFIKVFMDGNIEYMKTSAVYYVFKRNKKVRNSIFFIGLYRFGQTKWPCGFIIIWYKYHCQLGYVVFLMSFDFIIQFTLTLIECD